MTATNPPWHHWPVAILALLFYGLAVAEYLLARLGVGFYFNLIGSEAAEFVRSLPVWLNAVWALCVWGGLLGAWLQWKRNRYSVHLLFLAFGALALFTVWASIFTRPTIIGLAGFSGFYVALGTNALAFLLYLYARWERTEKLL